MSTDRMQNVKLVASCDIDPEVWIDFLEGELDSSYKDDLSRHSLECPRCLSQLKELRSVRSFLKPKNLDLPSQDFFKNLENKIMAGVEKTYIESPRPKWSEKAVKFALPTAAMFVIVIGSLFVSRTLNHRVYFGAKNNLNPEEQIFVRSMKADPEALGDLMMSDKDSDEFVMDVASQMMEQMSEQEAQEVLERIR